MIFGDQLDSLPHGAVVAAAMSGGVDSSVAAARCVERGFRVIGITLAMWPRDQSADRDRGCCSVDAVEDARRVCATLGIPHYAWNLEREFHDTVIDDFESEYAQNRTPNPCVRCNEWIKFGALLERARAVGATHVATGHYARRGRRDDMWTLHRAVDSRKDQAYTLYRLNQEQLASAVFPLGSMASKDDVRREAERLGLVTAYKAESQELCFVSGPMRVELQRRLADSLVPGQIVEMSGKVVGEHDGLPLYTIGQRRHLNVGGASVPLYVVAVDAERNEVVVGPKEALLREVVEGDECRWISGMPPEPNLSCDVQLRAHGARNPTNVVGATLRDMILRCTPAVDHVAPGQSAVLFSGDEVLGGGTVVRAA